MADEIRHTRMCPNCGNKIAFSEDQKTVHCECCDSDFSVGEILATKSYGNNAELAVNSIDTSESGLAYLDSVFETMDWDDFILNNPSLTVPTMDAVVNKIKIKFSNSADAWLFEFKSWIIPVNKRIEKLAEIISDIEKLYGEKDKDDEIHGLFDSYKFVVKKLVSCKNNIYKQLEVDLNFMKKFKLNNLTLASCTKEFNTLKEKLDKLNEVKYYHDLPEIRSLVESKEKNKVLELLKKGIDANKVYHDAVENYLKGNKKMAFDMFKKISGFRDADYYLKKLNTFYIVDSTLLECGGCIYVYQKAKNNGKEEGAKKKKGAVSNLLSNSGKGIYKIVDGIVQAEPIAKQIQTIIGLYADKLYYLSTENKIEYFDIQALTITTLFDLKDCTLEKENAIRFDKAAKLVFLGPNAESPKGCSLFKKNKGKDVKTFSFRVLDFATATITSYADDVLCINENHDGHVFFTKGVFDNNGNLERKEIYHFEVATCALDQPFSREVLIYCVCKDYLIYAQWCPNINNMDLYSLNLRTKEKVLLEKNIYECCGYFEGKVYFTVGNFEYQPLYAINPDGTGLKEIVQNCDEIERAYAGYIYIVSGYGYYTYLYKMKADGSNKTVVCNDFSEIIKIKNGYVYYKDNDDCLHIVRSDGREDRLVVEELEDVYSITDDKIFFTRREYIGKSLGIDKYGSSLYVMDADGHNTHKVAFNADVFGLLDENMLVYSQQEKFQVEVTKMGKRGPVSEPEVRTSDVEVYYGVNVNTLEISRLYIKNAPVFDSNFATGCFGKKKAEYPPQIVTIEYVYPFPSKIKVKPNTPNEGEKGASATVAKITKNAGCGTASRK